MSCLTGLYFWNVGNSTVCRQTADIVLVLDQSTSIVTDDYENWYTQILGFAVEIVMSFEIGLNNTQIGLLKFSDEVEVGFYLDDYHSEAAVSAAIRRLDILGGDTNIAAALQRTRSEMFSLVNGARSGVSKIMILVTDGSPTVDAHLTVPEAVATKEAGIEIFAVGITSRVNINIVRQIVSQPSDSHFFYVEMFSQLSHIVTSLVNASCAAIPRTVISTSTITTTTTTTVISTTRKRTTTNLATTSGTPGELSV